MSTKGRSRLQKQVKSKSRRISGRNLSDHSSRSPRGSVGGKLGLIFVSLVSCSLIDSVVAFSPRTLDEAVYGKPDLKDFKVRHDDSWMPVTRSKVIDGLDVEISTFATSEITHKSGQPRG